MKKLVENTTFLPKNYFFSKRTKIKEIMTILPMQNKKLDKMEKYFN